MNIEEIIAFLLGGGMAFFLVVRPVYRFLKAVTPKERDPLEAAKERLEIARREAEAAKLNKETDKIYNDIYSETLDDTNNNNKRSTH